MKINKLTLSKYLCLTFILCLLVNSWLQKPPIKQTDNALVLFVAIDQCCSLKLKRAAKFFSASVTIGH
jgi:hypothetical protein